MAHAIEERNDRGLRTDGGRKGFDRVVEVEGLAAQQHDVEGLLQRVGLHGRRLLQRDSPARALDDEARSGELLGAAWPDQKRDVASRLQQPASEISADRSGTDHENAHLLVSFLANGEFWRSSEWGRLPDQDPAHATRYSLFAIAIAIRYSLFAIRHPTTFPRTGGFPSRRSRRSSAADTIASKRRQQMPAASEGPDWPRAPPCRGARSVRWRTQAVSTPESMMRCATWIFCGPSSRAMACATPRRPNLALAKAAKPRRRVSEAVAPVKKILPPPCGSISRADSRPATKPAQQAISHTFGTPGRWFRESGN